MRKGLVIQMLPHPHLKPLESCLTFFCWCTAKCYGASGVFPCLTSSVYSSNLPPPKPTHSPTNYLKPTMSSYQHLQPTARRAISRGDYSSYEVWNAKKENIKPYKELGAVKKDVSRHSFVVLRISIY